jgi:hypothetical protein
MRGLLAIEPLYHQIVKGNKTQTRRDGGLKEVNQKPDCWFLTAQKKGVAIFLFNQLKQRNPSHVIEVTCKARYKIGEILYLKEPYNKELLVNDPDNDYREYRYSYKYSKRPHIQELLKWENKLFMPEKAAREFIRITDIRCERLLDISQEDSIAEGITGGYVPGPDKGTGNSWDNMVLYGWRDYSIEEGKEQHPYDLYGYPPDDAKGSFISLYKFANKMKATAAIPNLWVRVYTFECLKDFKP